MTTAEDKGAARGGGSKRPWWTRLVVITVVACLGFVGVRWFVTSYTCNGMGQKRAPSLAKLPELQLHPQDAAPQGTPSWNCDQDQDEETWYVSQRFESADVYPAAGVAYYRKALRAAGWSTVTGLAPGEGYPEDNGFFKGPHAIACFTRRVNGAQLYLLVQYPKLSQRGKGEYELQATQTSSAGWGCF